MSKLVWRDVMAQSIPDNSSQAIYSSNAMLQDALSGLKLSISDFNKGQKDRALSGAMEALTKYKDSNDAHDALVSGAIFENIDSKKLSYEDRLNLLKTIGDIGELNRGEQTKSMNDQNITMNDQSIRSNDLSYAKDSYSFGRTRREDALLDALAGEFGFSSKKEADAYFELAGSANTLDRDNKYTRNYGGTSDNEYYDIQNTSETNSINDEQFQKAFGMTKNQYKSRKTNNEYMDKIYMSNEIEDIRKLNTNEERLNYINNSAFRDNPEYKNQLINEGLISENVLGRATTPADTLASEVMNRTILDRLDLIDKTATFDTNESINISSGTFSPGVIDDLNTSTKTVNQVKNELLDSKTSSFNKVEIDEAVNALLDAGLNPAQAQHIIENNVESRGALNPFRYTNSKDTFNLDSIKRIANDYKSGALQDKFADKNMLKINNNKITSLTQQMRDLETKRVSTVNDVRLSQKQKDKIIEGITSDYDKLNQELNNLTRSQERIKERYQNVYRKEDEGKPINSVIQSKMQELRNGNLSESDKQDTVEYLKKLGSKPTF